MSLQIFKEKKGRLRGEKQSEKRRLSRYVLDSGGIRVVTFVQMRFTHNFLCEHILYLVSFERALHCGQFDTIVNCAQCIARIERAIT